jgi:hypothetical protein
MESLRSPDALGLLRRAWGALIRHGDEEGQKQRFQ